MGELFGIATVSVHFGAESSPIDMATAALAAEQVCAAELRANQAVCENRPITIAFADNSDELGLRKASERAGVLRVGAIEGLDRSACGGTHVRATGEIGPLLVRKLDKVRGTVRVEFLCGLRALRRARADYDALAGIAQALSAPLDEAPGLVAAQMETLKNAGKERRRVEAELGRLTGRELYDAAPADSHGPHRAGQRLPSGALAS